MDAQPKDFLSIEDENISLWRQKKELERLEKFAGQHTSLISLLIPPGTQIARVGKLLTTELGTATQIKSRVNRQSVLDALKSVQHRVKLMTWLPKNGLAIFCGTVFTEDNKPRKTLCMLEPIKPIPNFVYRCDSSFHLEPLKDMLSESYRYGFVVVDGSGALFAAVQGNTQDIIHRYSVTLPKKHRKGGQSSVRFARLREEARHNYLTKLNELALKCYWDQETNKPNVAGLVLAGSADFKDQLQKNKLDPRLQEIVVSVVDVAYGFKQGLSQAIELTSDVLKDVALVKQKKLLAKFFEEISMDTGRFCFGIKDTLSSLESGAVGTLIVWDKLDIVRYEMTGPDGTSKIVFAKEGQEPKEMQEEKMEVKDSTPFIDWLAEHYQDYGAKLEIVQDASAEGSQFCKGFGGVGALLRYQMDFHGEDDDYEGGGSLESDEDDLSEYFGDVGTANGKEEEGEFF